MVRIRDYQKDNPQLLASHHFVAWVPLVTGVDRFDFVVFGLNPGEQEDNWLRHPGPTEETVDYNWLGDTPTRQATAWRNKVRSFCGSDNVLQSDFFFWSTPDIGSTFRKRFGTSFAKSPHFAFCRGINEALVDIAKPKAIIAVGVSHAPFLSELYGLGPPRASIPDEAGRQLIVHYERDGLPWIFSKHWGGAFGFTKGERMKVREYIAAATGA